MEQPIVLQGVARLLVVLHTAGAIVLIGSTTHHAIITWGYLRGRAMTRLGRIYAATSAVAYLLTFLLGALSYPTYRYYTRALYFDRYAPWATTLFDVKEHFASLGLPLVLGVLWLSRGLEPRRDRAVLPVYAVLVVGTAAIVWFNLFSGLVVVLEKGV
jgi:hypothetical protein